MRSVSEPVSHSSLKHRGQTDDPDRQEPIQPLLAQAQSDRLLGELRVASHGHVLRPGHGLHSRDGRGAPEVPSNQRLPQAGSADAVLTGGLNARRRCGARRQRDDGRGERLEAQEGELRTLGADGDEAGGGRLEVGLRRPRLRAARAANPRTAPEAHPRGGVGHKRRRSNAMPGMSPRHCRLAVATVARPTRTSEATLCEAEWRSAAAP